MNVENLMTDPAATTTEGNPASQPTEQPGATGAQDEGQQHPETQGSVEGQQQQNADPDTGDVGETNKAEGAPETYEFQMPEGQEVDEAIVSQFSETARELNLSQEAAQQLLDKMAPVIAERQAEQIAAVQAQWAEESRADKEFGGDHLNENLGLAKKAMDQFATPELRTLLNESGMGNHPEVIRMFVRVGKSISEDGFVSGNGPATKPGDAKSFYPNSNMN